MPIHNRTRVRRVPLAKPSLGNPEIKAVSHVIRSGWVTQGPEVAAFEEDFARTVGASHAVAVSSCTTALHLALKVVGVTAGDEVITASHSFVATANSIRYCGALPVFADIDSATFNMDPSQIKNLITRRTKAILCVHQMGMPCDLKAISAIARRAGVPLIEDAACAIGSEILWNGRWERIGKPHGDIACFSFHPRKVITTGDGGMLTTSNPKWAGMFRLWRQHGMSVSDSVRHASTSFVAESYKCLGYNYRMTDIQAALGRMQLKRLSGLVHERRRLAERYFKLLSQIPGIHPPQEPEWARSNWQSYCVRLPVGVDLMDALDRMTKAGIGVRRGVQCAHQEPVYVRQESWSCGSGPGRCGCKPGTCRNLAKSESAREHCLILPLFPEMSRSDQQFVVRILENSVRSRN